MEKDENISSSKATIKFINKTDKSLYKWCLEETFENEEKKEYLNDFIPFVWSVNFVAKNLKYNFGIENDRIGGDKNKIISKEGISGDLVTFGDDEHIKIKMFGSKKAIGSINLWISKISEGGYKNEQCRVSAFDEYETEDSNFIEYVEPSVMHVEIYLNDMNFNSLANAVKSDSIDVLHLRISHVYGLYHNWTPTIHSEGINILKDIDNVIFDKDVTASQKKLVRTVGKDTCEFNLSIHKTTLKEQNSKISELDDDNDYEDDASEKAELSAADIRYLVKSHFKNLNTISNTLMVIAFILVLSLFIN